MKLSVSLKIIKYLPHSFDPGKSDFVKLCDILEDLLRKKWTIGGPNGKITKENTSSELEELFNQFMKPIPLPAASSDIISVAESKPGIERAKEGKDHTVCFDLPSACSSCRVIPTW